MKLSITFAISLIAFSVFSQDNFYTEGLPNGFAWTAPPSVSKIAYSKSESLSEMLVLHKFKTDIQKEISFPLDCDEDIEKLLKSNSSSTIELETIEKMIDEFYESAENLKIPVIGAYCYNIKKLAGYSYDELKYYKRKLIDFCNSNLKK